MTSSPKTLGFTAKRGLTVFVTALISQDALKRRTGVRECEQGHSCLVSREMGRGLGWLRRTQAELRKFKRSPSLENNLQQRRRTWAPCLSLTL